jgi:DNA-directed RNA polymerase subunit RPC12/RpoP
MKLITKCFRCSKKLFFFSKKKKEDSNTFCPTCHKQILEEKEKQRQKRIQKSKEKKKIQKIINSQKADQKLREELENLNNKPENKTQPQTKEKLKPKKKAKPITSQKLKKKTELVTKSDIENNVNLLFIKADVKQLQVIEWINQKKRIAVNKSREVRRTHAGGFSAEKFQKFVDFKKNTTSDWITNILQRPGILKENYDKIIYDIEDENLKKEIKTFLENYFN